MSEELTQATEQLALNYIKLLNEIIKRHSNIAMTDAAALNAINDGMRVAMSHIKKSVGTKE
ncbi:hypothetical protein [Sporomusa sp.]|uniref:hypothetical protein n=1 Tax=Sporomusa sp. TaxID=2078658 RepID=UPI002BC56B0F|nr:hypothetical protein [Sporomusa sp.]HWR07791.1 hypothetical protein [Sporomusa sp.]